MSEIECPRCETRNDVDGHVELAEAGDPKAGHCPGCGKDLTEPLSSYTDAF